MICVHGLTRQGRDFDVLARTLARAGWRVICPDLVGRGTSDWLTDSAGYTLLQYGADMNALTARLDIEEVDWIGTSLGSLVGMVLAGQPGAPIRQLVINDIGPFIPGTAPRRLGLYLTNLPQRFADLAKAEAYIREIMAPTATSRRNSGSAPPSTASAGTVPGGATCCAWIPASPRPTAPGGSAVF